jgi:type IX secretion system PorP/SprF family membrane protein
MKSIFINKVKLILIILIFNHFLCNYSAYSQIYPLSTINFTEKYSVNKAYAGISGNKILNFKVRQQWVNLKNSPVNYKLSYILPLPQIKSGAGFEVDVNNQSIFQQISGGASYNYIMNTDFGTFSFGPSFSFSNIYISGDRILTPEGKYEDGIYNPYDDFIELIGGNNEKFIGSNLFFVFFLNTFEFGIEFDNIIKLEAITRNKYLKILKVNFQYQYLLNENMSFRFNDVFYSDLVLWQNDMSLVSIINGNFLAGINFRGISSTTFESIGLITGADLTNSIKLIYSYDFGINSLNRIHSGSHELSLYFNFGKSGFIRRAPPVIFNPRLTSD